MAPVRVVVLSFFYPLVIFTHELHYSLLSQLLAFHHFTSYFSWSSLSMLTGIRFVERGCRRLPRLMSAVLRSRSSSRLSLIQFDRVMFAELRNAACL
jgi:hypothetical protein